jgi:hypothetical protein
VPLTALDVARAAYIWQLQGGRYALSDQLAELEVAFRWLLRLQTDEVTTELLRARTAYVAELHAGQPDLDGAIANLAMLHQNLISAELDRAAALSTPPRRPGSPAPRPRAPARG